MSKLITAIEAARMTGYSLANVYAAKLANRFPIEKGFKPTSRGVQSLYDAREVKAWAIKHAQLIKDNKLASKPKNHSDFNPERAGVKKAMDDHFYEKELASILDDPLFFVA